MLCVACNIEISPHNVHTHQAKHLRGELEGSNQWRSAFIDVVVGTSTINHPVVTERQWVSNMQTDTKQVDTNQERCTICGDIRTM